MNALTLNGKSFAVLLMGQTAAGQDDWAVFAGTFRTDDKGFFLDRGQKPPFEIDADWLERIKPVSGSVKETLLGAEFYLSLTIGPLPEGESAETFVETGLRWPT